jgi:hypothetical protein
VWTAFSLRFSPTKSAPEQILYALSYGPVLLLGIAGGIRYWHSWRDHSLIYLAVLTFMAHSAIFWAHTAHRVYLDVYLIVLAAGFLASPGCRTKPPEDGGFHQARR